MIRINALSMFIIQQILRNSGGAINRYANFKLSTLPIFAAEYLFAVDLNSLPFEDTDGCYSNGWYGFTSL